MDEEIQLEDYPKLIWGRHVDARIMSDNGLEHYFKFNLATPWESGKIKLDRSLINVLEAYSIVYNNGNGYLYDKLVHDGVFEDIKHYGDSEWSSINVLFDDYENFMKFVENFIVWLKNEPKSYESKIIAVDTETEIS